VAKPKTFYAYLLAEETAVGWQPAMLVAPTLKIRRNL
jgi:hypothetical protein